MLFRRVREIEEQVEVARRVAQLAKKPRDLTAMVYRMQRGVLEQIANCHHVGRPV